MTIEMKIKKFDSIKIDTVKELIEINSHSPAYTACVMKAKMRFYFIFL
jgi:hypothetical protein